MSIKKIIDKYFGIEPSLLITHENRFQKRTLIPYRLVIHHSAGNEMIDATEHEVQDGFNSWGQYQWNNDYKIFKSYHKLPTRDEPSYCSTQYAMHKYKGGWRIVPLMRYPLSEIAWHSGDPETELMKNVNTLSLGIEICGTFTDKYLDNEGLQTIARLFKPYNKYLEKFHGKSLLITGHKDHMPTICPGMIYEQLHALRSMIYR